MKLKTTLFAAVASLALAPAAQAYEGLYGAIGAGLNYVGDDRDVENNIGLLLGNADPAPYLFDSEADYDNGIGVYTTLGYAFGNSWRSELELSHRDNDVRHWAGDNLGFNGFPDITGGIKAQSVMFNVLRDFGAGNLLTPYLGVGIGVSRLRGDFSAVNAGLAIPTMAAPTWVDINDYETGLAYQGIAGVGVNLAQNLILDLSYRYFRTDTPTFRGTLNGAPETFKTDYAAHNLFAGLRWNFGAVTPPPPPAPEYKDCWDGSSVPVSSYCPTQLVEEVVGAPDPINVIVYFDYDKSNLTPEASSLIREAASRALSNDIESVVVTGNTDTSGSSAYNEALSQRRASVVREALIANGVPADRIDTRSFGENNLAKSTPDGTREPLNRRSEVMISFE